MRLSRGIQHVGLGLAIALLGGAKEGRTQDTTPILYEDARIYVPIMGEHGPLGMFILDTGADECLIDSSVADRAGVRFVGAVDLFGAGRRTLSGEEAGPIRLRIGDTDLPLLGVHVAALDARLFPYEGRHFAGLIGAPLFRRFVVSVDFAGRTLALNDPRTFDYRGVGVRLPLRFAGEAPIVEATLVLPGARILPVRLLIDLGAPAGLLLTEPFANAHPELAHLTPRVTEPLGAGVGGEVRFAFARLPGLQVGPLAAHDLVVGLSTGGALRGAGYDGILGARFLQRYRVIFDYSRQQIILEPGPLSEPDRFDRSGAYLVQDPHADHRFTVHFVARGSPAEMAGLAPGDVLVRIDGRPADEDTLSEIRRILTSAASMVPIVVERRGRTVTAIVRLRDLP